MSRAPVHLVSLLSWCPATPAHRVTAARFLRSIALPAYGAFSIVLPHACMSCLRSPTANGENQVNVHEKIIFVFCPRTLFDKSYGIMNSTIPHRLQSSVSLSLCSGHEHNAAWNCHLRRRAWLLRQICYAIRKKRTRFEADGRRRSQSFNLRTNCRGEVDVVFSVP